MGMFGNNIVFNNVPLGLTIPPNMPKFCRIQYGGQPWAENMSEFQW